MFYIDPRVDIQSCNLVVPSISIGNVPQLAIDLIINTVKPKYVGFIVHEHVVPVVGSNAFNASSSKITTSCEVFHHAPKRLLFLQIRGAIVQGKEHQFSRDVLEWAERNRIQNVICLTSILADVRKDKDLVGCQIRYLLPPKSQSDLVKKFEKFGWTEYEDPRLPELKEGWDPRRTYIPRGGWGQILYDLGNNMGLDSTLIMMYAYEGDNTIEAMEMASAVNTWIKIIPATTWIKPVSWCGVYGDAPPPNLY